MNIQLEKKNVTDLQADLIVIEKGTLGSAGQPDPAGRTFLEVSAPDWEEGKNGLIPKLSRRYQKGLDEALKKERRDRKDDHQPRFRPSAPNTSCFDFLKSATQNDLSIDFEAKLRKSEIRHPICQRCGKAGQ